MRMLALVAATAFSVSLSLSCVEAAFSTAASQMACCKDGELSCAPTGSSADCCRTTVTRSQPAPSATKIDTAHALSVVAAIPSRPVVAVLPPPRPIVSSNHFIQIGPPPYIAHSSLLI